MTSDKKTLLIISGGIEAVDAAKRARDMGLTVVVSDRDPEAPGFAFADSCLIADVYGANETAAAAERYNRKIRKIDGVICVAADAPVTAATVAQRLRLPGLPVHVAELACDKLAMKKCFRSAGVNIPWFAEVMTPQELQRIAVERGRDLVIKPVDSRGSRGVQRVAQVEDLNNAFLMERSHSQTERVMVEQYLAGPQVSTESIVTGGRCFTPGFSDRNYEYLERYAPFFIENGGDLPSHLPEATPGQGAGAGGAGGQCALRHRRQRERRHRRACRRTLCDRAGGAAVGRLFLHPGNSPQHRRRFHRRRDPDRPGRAGRRSRTDAETFHPCGPALCLSRAR